MNTEEFSNEFDVLLNSYNPTEGIGNSFSESGMKLDEYEKSVFLTKSQEDIILEVYSGKNIFNDSFERTEEIRRYLSPLIRTAVLVDKVSNLTGLSPNSVFYILPEDLWFITYEAAVLNDDSLGCLNGEEILVTPVTQDTYYRINKNPFRGPSKNRALRLDTDNNVVEIVSDYNIEKYLLRYLIKPKPIILLDLEEGLSINEVSIKTECELHPAIHRLILERAVKLAIISKLKLENKTSN